MSSRTCRPHASQVQIQSSGARLAGSFRPTRLTYLAGGR